MLSWWPQLHIKASPNEEFIATLARRILGNAQPKWMRPQHKCVSEFLERIALLA